MRPSAQGERFGDRLLHQVQDDLQGVFIEAQAAGQGPLPGAVMEASLVRAAKSPVPRVRVAHSHAASPWNPIDKVRADIGQLPTPWQLPRLVERVCSDLTWRTGKTNLEES